MASPVEFVSIKGRVYTPKTVLPVVLSILARRFHFKGSVWRAAVRAEMADPDFLRRCNGMCPAGLAYEVETVAMIAGIAEEHARLFPKEDV